MMIHLFLLKKKKFKNQFEFFLSTCVCVNSAAQCSSLVGRGRAPCGWQLGVSVSAGGRGSLVGPGGRLGGCGSVCSLWSGLTDHPQGLDGE